MSRLYVLILGVNLYTGTSVIFIVDNEEASLCLQPGSALLRLPSLSLLARDAL
jgi:hypothetical protein